MENFPQVEQVNTRLEQCLAQSDAATRTAAQAGWDEGQAAAHLLHSWGVGPIAQIAAIVHNFVYNQWLELHALASVLDETQLNRVRELCRDYAQIVLGSDAPVRGRSRAVRRMRYFRAAHRDGELVLMAVALLWVQVHRRMQVGGHMAAAAREDARSILCPVLDMLGMQEPREELHQRLWPPATVETTALTSEPATQSATQSATPSATEPLLAQIAADICNTLAGLLPQAQCERRFPCREAVSVLPSAGTRTGHSIDIAICVPQAEGCYRALYQLHQHFAVIEGSFADTLRLGRINGGRALHTAVTVPSLLDRVRVNFQIYAHSMAAVNRWGLAALGGKLGSPALADSAPQAWWHQAGAGQTHIESAAPGSLPETLYVFSPQGQLFRFHRGCTVVDFAYHVHTDLADQCRRFYINDEPVEPNAVLHHLDIVALEHDPQSPGPTPLWLNAAHTGRARHAIERFLNRRGRGLDQGRRLLDERRRHLEQHYGFNLPEHRLAQAMAGALRTLRLNRVDELLDELAAGRLAADQILHPLFADELARQLQLPRRVRLRPHQIQISQCCRPRTGEDIVGLVTRRHGAIVRLRVHRADCTRVDADHAHEHMDLTWRLQPGLLVSEQLELTAHDEDELLGDAVKQVYARLPHVMLRKVEAAARHGVARLRFHLEAESQDVLDELAGALDGLPNRQVVEVRRLRLPPSELALAESLHNAGVANRGAYNPYTRLPVHEQAMFFGRTRELEQILSWLRGGAGSIWLLGQKRVGKTSLLFHLKHHFLPEWGYVAAFVDFQLLGNLAAGNPCYEVAAAVFADLQGDARLGEGGPLTAPVRALFDLQPAMELIAYLRTVSSRIRGAGGRTRLVILLDEFSRTTDAYLQEQLDRSFFELWRGVMQATAPEISYITVVQQQTYNAMSQRARQHLDDPSWHIMELGEKLVLRPLDGEAVRRLIEWPMRNFVEFRPESVAYVAALTGGNPFLIQAFCFKLAAHMAHQSRRQVEWGDIEAVRLEFMLPTESVFAHFLDMLRGGSQPVCQALAILAQDRDEASAPADFSLDSSRNQVGAAREPVPVTWDELCRALPALPAPTLRRTLQELTTCDILVEAAPNAWAFSSRLFQQWLALNAE